MSTRTKYGSCQLADSRERLEYKRSRRSGARSSLTRILPADWVVGVDTRVLVLVVSLEDGPTILTRLSGVQTSPDNVAHIWNSTIESRESTLRPIARWYLRLFLGTARAQTQNQGTDIKETLPLNHTLNATTNAGLPVLELNLHASLRWHEWLLNPCTRLYALIDEARSITKMACYYAGTYAPREQTCLQYGPHHQFCLPNIQQ